MTLTAGSRLGPYESRWASFLPGSRGLLITTKRQGRYDIDLLRMDTMKPETIISQPTSATG